VTTPQAVYPHYAVPLSPRPRTPYKDLMLVVMNSAELFAGLFSKGTAVAWGFRHLAKHAETLAVETTGNPNPRPRCSELSKDRPPNIGIRITQGDHGLFIEVWDSARTPPQGADAHLTIVANVSQDGGCYRPGGGRKVIWTELAVPRQRRAQHHGGFVRDSC